MTACFFGTLCDLLDDLQRVTRTLPAVRSRCELYDLIDEFDGLLATWDGPMPDAPEDEDEYPVCR